MNGATASLLVDIGNSRVKWALLQQGQLTASHAMARPAVGEMAQVLAQLPSTAPAAVWVANVAGEAFAAAFDAALQRRWNVAPRHVAAEAEAFGVINGYRQPGQLGVDRWLAMIAARRLAEGPLCVVGCGSALTIDGVRADGRHVGGLIAPGVGLMRRSVIANTAGVRPVEAAAGHGVFGLSTDEALEAGTRYAAMALIERANNAFRESLGDQMVCVITGGEAMGLKDELNVDCRYVPDLVLRGLACYAT